MLVWNHLNQGAQYVDLNLLFNLKGIMGRTIWLSHSKSGSHAENVGTSIKSRVSVNEAQTLSCEFIKSHRFDHLLPLIRTSFWRTSINCCFVNTTFTLHDDPLHSPHLQTQVNLLVSFHNNNEKKKMQKLMWLDKKLSFVSLAQKLWFLCKCIL